MKTRILFIGIMALGTTVFGQVTASDYFPFKQNTSYTLDCVLKNKTKMKLECDSINGNTARYYEYEPWGAKKLYIYEATDSTIQVIAKNTTGYRFEDENPPHVFLKLPVVDSIIQWQHGTDTFYSSEYQDSVEAGGKTYEDCIVITQTSKPEYGLGTHKRYYAKGVGLVRIEFIVEDELVPNMTFDLTATSEK